MTAWRSEIHNFCRVSDQEKQQDGTFKLTLTEPQDTTHSKVHVFVNQELVVNGRNTGFILAVKKIRTEESKNSKAKLFVDRVVVFDPCPRTINCGQPDCNCKKN